MEDNFFIKKKLQSSCFSLKFAKFLRKLFFMEHLMWLFLLLVMKISKILSWYRHFCLFSYGLCDNDARGERKLAITNSVLKTSVKFRNLPIKQLRYKLIFHVLATFCTCFWVYLHFIKYARIWVFTDRILPYKDKIYDFVLVRENTG